MNEQRMHEILTKESEQPLAWWWLSFCDADLPKGSQFLGACLVKAKGMLSAMLTARALGINPGGEVEGSSIPIESKIQDEWANRLLTRDECEEFDRVHQGKL